MGHVYGYARVSTNGQSYEEQEKDLKAAGCERTFSDKASGKNTNRPGFEEMSKTLLPGDTVIICKLDRLGRNLQDLIGIIDGYGKRGIGFKVLDNANIDTTTPQGKLIFNLFASFAEYERELILERTAKGRAAAKEKGRTGGRKSVITKDQIDDINKLSDSKSIKDACKALGISRASFYRLQKKSVKAVKKPAEVPAELPLLDRLVMGYSRENDPAVMRTMFSAILAERPGTVKDVKAVMARAIKEATGKEEKLPSRFVMKGVDRLVAAGLVGVEDKVVTWK